jgi:hypothetical protein
MIAMLLLQSGGLAAQEIPAPEKATRITTRIDFAYVPIGEIDFANRNVQYEIYDNLLYRASCEYFVSDLISIGPGFEYSKKRVNPEATFDEDMTQTNFYLDFRINHSLTDSGANYLVFGLGTGIGRISESDNVSGTGFGLYGIVGFDIMLGSSMGLDLLYRYQANSVTVEDHDYKFNGSALEAGLNYRFRF